MTRREGHGWWPYWLPLMSFLVLGEIAVRFPETWRPGFLPLKVAVPGLLLVFFFARGAYPELRGWRPAPREWLPDVAVGVLGALLWMAPYLFALEFDPPLWTAWPELLRPQPDDAFDPNQLGAGLVGVTLALRVLGYAVVTPFAEELFVRSWLARFADVYNRPLDFRDVPIARFTWRSFCMVVVFFTVSHVPWEWPVAILWIVGTQLWFYRRRKLGAMVVVHAASNLAIFLFVWLTNQYWFFL